MAENHQHKKHVPVLHYTDPHTSRYQFLFRWRNNRIKKI